MWRVDESKRGVSVVHIHFGGLGSSNCVLFNLRIGVEH